MKWFVSAAMAGAVSLAFGLEARAHIDLTYPPMNMGSNQKGAAPCGGGAAAPVTTFKPGETIMVKFTETVYHPGHFRIAVFGEGMAAPADPTSYTDIKMPAVAPIMADGLFKHTSGGRKAWETPITLPNVPCAKCSLQLIQVMQQGAFDGSPGGSLYRRCANIVLAGSASPADGGAPDAGGGSPDAGSGSGGAGGSSGGTGGSSGGTGGSSGSTGGSSGSTGGSTGSGGTTAGSGGTTAGSGGTTAGSGGTTAGSGGSTGTARGGSTGSTTPSGSDAGGGCSVGGSESQPGAWALLALVMGLMFASRRRTRLRSR